jgi:large subunit ribosomal protein L17
MRHRNRGRKLSRTGSHRRAMFRNMAASLLLTVRPEEGADNTPQVKGRIVTTVAKAKELRPVVEKLVTIAKKALPHQEAAEQHATKAEKNSAEWKTWRKGEGWQKWTKAIAPAIKYRRMAFDVLRDKEAVEILFTEVAPKFRERTGGYTRVIEIATRRLGDSGKQALIEFVGERDRVKSRKAPAVVSSEASAS